MMASAQGNSVTSQHNLKDAPILRVFVSSPFSGMELERDCLSKLYWPRLKSLLISKGLLLRVIDLRWGISSEMSSDHQTITTCLREIQRSDLFVGLYAQRYGWSGTADKSLQKNFDRALERFPWVSDFRDRSITELEYLEGHLNVPGRTPACFCFRDPAYDAKISERAHKEGDTKRYNNHRSENAESARHLEELKQCVDATRSDTLGVLMNYETPEAGAEFIYKCIREYVNDVILAQQKHLSKWETSEQAHNLFLSSRAGIYVGGEKYIEQLNAFMAGDGSKGPLVITGPTGCGKTALLTNWLYDRRQSEQPEDFVITHFVGAHPKSSRPENLVKRIVWNIDMHIDSRARKTDKDYEVRLKPDQLTSRLLQSLENISKHSDKNKVIVIIDRIEEVDADKSFKPLYWLPQSIPTNVYVVVTITTGSSSADAVVNYLITQHTAQKMEVGGLAASEKKVLTEKILKQYSKSMETEQLELILNSGKTDQPFFLRTLVHELCISGKFRTLTSQIEDYLGCEGVTELFEIILDRIGQDYNNPEYDGDLVRDVLCAIGLSKRGISELELPMPQYMWTPLIYAMEKYLINRSGLLSFGFPELTVAVERKYLSDVDSKRKAALKVSEIFYKPFQEFVIEGTPISKRVAIELPHLLSIAEDHKCLLEVVSNIKVFETLYRTTPFVLNDYWQVLGLPGEAIARRYLLSLDTYVASRYSVHSRNMDEESIEELMDWKAGILPSIRRWMLDSKIYSGMEVIFDREISLLSRIVGKSDVQHMKSMSEVKFEKASFLANTGRYQEAEKLHQQVLALTERLEEAGLIRPEVKARSHNAIGRCCYKLGRMREAEEWYLLTMKTIGTDTTEGVHLAWVYYNIGMVYFDQKDYKTALNWFNKAVGKWEELEPHKLSLGLAVNYLHIGTVHLNLGEIQTAETLYNKALTINRTLLGNHSIDVAKCLTSLSHLEHIRKNLKKSLDLVRQSIHIFKMMAPKGYHRTTLAEEMMVKQLLKGDNHKEAEPIVDDLVQQLQSGEISTTDPMLYEQYVEKCLGAGEYQKASDWASRLLKTTNESDVLVAQLLTAYGRLDDNGNATNYKSKLEYGLSKWPQSRPILTAHLRHLKQAEPERVLAFVREHCAQQNEACYHAVCDVIQDVMGDNAELTQSVLNMGPQYQEGEMIWKNQ